MTSISEQPKKNDVVASQASCPTPTPSSAKQQKTKRSPLPLRLTALGMDDMKCPLTPIPMPPGSPLCRRGSKMRLRGTDNVDETKWVLQIVDTRSADGEMLTLPLPEITAIGFDVYAERARSDFCARCTIVRKSEGFDWALWFAYGKAFLVVFFLIMSVLVLLGPVSATIAAGAVVADAVHRSQLRPAILCSSVAGPVCAFVYLSLRVADPESTGLPAVLMSLACVGAGAAYQVWLQGENPAMSGTDAVAVMQRLADGAQELLPMLFQPLELRSSPAHSQTRYPVELWFDEDAIQALFAIRRKLFGTSRYQHLVSQTFVSNRYVETLLCFVLPSAVYNSLRLRRALQLFMDVLLPFFFVVQAACLILPFLFAHLAWFRSLVRADMATGALVVAARALGRLFGGLFGGLGRFLQTTFGSLAAMVARVTVVAARPVLHVVERYVLPSDFILAYIRARFAHMRAFGQLLASLARSVAATAMPLFRLARALLAPVLGLVRAASNVAGIAIRAAAGVGTSMLRVFLKPWAVAWQMVVRILTVRKPQGLHTVAYKSSRTAETLTTKLRLLVTPVGKTERHLTSTGPGTATGTGNGRGGDGGGNGDGPAKEKKRGQSVKTKLFASTADDDGDDDGDAEAAPQATASTSSTEEKAAAGDDGGGAAAAAAADTERAAAEGSVSEGKGEGKKVS